MPDPVQQWQASHPGVPVPWYVQEQETGGVSNGNVPGGIVNSSIDPNPGTAQTASQSTATSNPYSNATDYGDQTAWGGHYLGAAQAYDQSQQLASQAASLGSTQAVGLGLLGQQYAQQGAGYQGNAQTAFNQGNAAYAQGTNAVGLLGNAAAGKGPSAAQAQLTQGTDAAIAAEQAQGASVRGANGLANAGYQASQQGGQALLQASNQSAQLRAQEQQAAQAQYAQAATSLAGASYGASGQQGSLANQAYGQQLGATTAGDTAQQNMLGLQQGYTNQGDQVNTAAANTALGRLGLSQQQNQFTAAQQTQDIGAGLSAGGTVIGAAATMSDENAKTNVDAPAPAPPRWHREVADTTSDERTKDHDHEGDGGAADRFLGAISPHTYEYRDPIHEPRSDPNGGRYLGVMAQELEHSPEGRQVVEQGADGYRRLNIPALTSANTAALARLHQRLSALEGRIGGGG